MSVPPKPRSIRSSGEKRPALLEKPILQSCQTATYGGISIFGFGEACLCDSVLLRYTGTARAHARPLACLHPCDEMDHPSHLSSFDSCWIDRDRDHHPSSMIRMIQHERDLDQKVTPPRSNIENNPSNRNAACGPMFPPTFWYTHGPRSQHCSNTPLRCEPTRCYAQTTVSTWA